MADNFVMHVRQGDSFEMSMTLQDVDDTGAKVAMNLTGYTYEWFVSVGDSTNTYTAAPEIVVSNPTTGIIDFYLSPTATQDFTVIGRTWFRITSGDGSLRETILEGNIEVSLHE